MNYNLSIKSLYELFKEYGESRINIVLRRFKKEKTSYPLLQKQFGADLKQRTGLAVMNYMDTSRLQSILSRFEKLLKFVVRLEEEGKTEKEIINIIDTKDEIVLYKYVESLLGKKKEYATSNFNVNKYIKDKKITLKLLADAVDCHDNELEKKAFKYKYGLNISKMEDETIMSLLGITKTKLDDCIRAVANQLDSLLTKYVKMMEEYDLPVEVKKARVKVSSSKKEVKENPKKAEAVSVGVIGNKSLNKRFINYIITPLTLKEEIEHIEEKIKNATETEYIKSLNSYKIASRYFGKDLCSEFKGSYSSQSDTIMIKGLVSTIEKYIKTGSFRKTSGDKKQKESKYDGYFIDILISDLSESEQEIAKNNIYKIVFDLKGKYPKGYQLLIDMYDADLKSKNEKKKTLTKGESSSYRAIVKKAQEIIKFMCIEKVSDYETYKQNHSKKKQGKEEQEKYKKYFIEYFVDSNTTEEEKLNIQNKIINIIECCDALYKSVINRITPIYGEKLNEEINKNNIGQGTTRSLNSCVRKLKDTLLHYEEFINENKKYKSIANFIDISGLTDKEAEDYINKILEVLNTSYYKDLKPVIYLKEYFGDDLKATFTGTFVRGKASVIRTFFRNNLEKIKAGGIQKDIYKKKFIDYLIEGLSEEQIKDINNYYYIIMIYIKRNHNNLYQNLHKIYGPHLKNEFLDEKIISRDEKILLNHFLKNTFPKIIKNKMYLLNPYNGIATSLYNALEIKITNKEAEERIKKYLEIKLNTNYRAYQIIVDFFGTNLKSNINYSEIEVSKKVQIKKYIKEIQEFIDLPKEEYDKIIEETEKSLIDEVRIDGVSDEDIVKAIKYCLPREGTIYNLVIENYGENFDIKVNRAKFKKNDYQNIRYFINKCQKCLSGEISNIRTLKTGYEVLNNPEDSVEEQKITREKIELILAHKQPSQALTLLNMILDNNAPITIIEDKKEQLNVRAFIKTIKDELKDFSYSKYLEPNELVVVRIPEDISVVASLVLKFTKLYKDPTIVSEKLNIDIDTIVKVYLDHSSCLDLEQLLNYIIMCQPKYINELFGIEELKESRTLLTNKEKELLYLTLLSKTNSDITSKEISKITELDVSDVKNYRVMTRNDNVNKLNLLLHKRKRNK